MECGAVYSNSSKRGLHEKNHNKESVKCHYCDKELSDKSCLNRHILAKHKSENKKFKCEECDKTFTTYQQFKIHQTTHIKKESKYVCDLCQYVSSSDENLQTHKEYIHFGRTDYCPVEDCNYSTKTRYELPRHMKKHKEPHLFCEIDGCTFKTYTMQLFLRHIRNVHFKKEVECEASDCQQTFSCRDYMLQHMRIYHNSERYLQCPDCSFRITKNNKIVYEIHVRIHQRLKEEKTYCKRCNLTLAISFFKEKRFNRESSTRCKVCMHCNKREKKILCSCGVQRCRKYTPQLFCKHNLKKYSCKMCQGSKICIHGKDRYICKFCKRASRCYHGIEKKICKICEQSSYLSYIVRRRVNQALKKKINSANKYLGCDMLFYRDFLKKKFTPEMT